MKPSNPNQLTRSLLLPPLAIAADWLTIAAAIFVAKKMDSPLVTILSLIIIGARQHALFILTHEGVHVHLAPNKKLNDFLSNFFCAWPMLFDTEAYRRNHLKHHRHLNTDQDPDWVRKNGHKEWTFPVTYRQMARFLPYFVFLKGPTEWATIIWMFSGFGSKARWQNERFYLISKIAYFSAGFFCLFHFHLMKDALFYWYLPMFLVFPLIQRYRSIAEHFAVSYSNIHNSTRDVQAGWLEGFFIGPHNVNYHLTHHEYPHIPFYHLPRAHKHLCDIGEFQDAHINRTYLWPFSNSVLRDALYGPRTKISAEATATTNNRPAKSA